MSREARDEGLVALRSKYRVCLAWLINAVIHINEINIHKIPDISSSLFGSRVTSPAAMQAILDWSEPARTPLTSQRGVQQNNVYIYLTVNSAVLLLSSAGFLALSLRMNPTVLQFKWTFLAELSFSVFYFRIVQKEIWKCRWIFWPLWARELKQRQDYPVLLAKAFLSGARQPEVDFLHSWAVVLPKSSVKSSLKV